MTSLLFCTLLFLIACLAGGLGALTGLGGGFVVIPLLVIGFGIDIHYAMGASLVTVLATSTSANLHYLKNGFTNLRIGIFLEVGAVIGALIGALSVQFVPETWLSFLLGLILLNGAYSVWARQEIVAEPKPAHPWADYLQLNGAYPAREGWRTYRVYQVPWAFLVMTFAGMLSGLLGIGSGALKVLAMDQIMRLPYKVSTTTSNFMIGITAGVSVGVYFSHGYIDPILCFPIILGVLLGAFWGARILPFLATTKLRQGCAVVIFIFSVQMIYKGFFP